MTFRQLREKLNDLTDDNKLDSDVTILLLEEQECFAVLDFVTDWVSIDEPSKRTPSYLALGVDAVSGVLDEGHPYLTIPR